jgi:hypothetical protein
LLADQLTGSFKQHNHDFQSATTEAPRLSAFEQKKLCREQADRPECNFLLGAGTAWLVLFPNNGWSVSEV